MRSLPSLLVLLLLASSPAEARLARTSLGSSMSKRMTGKRASVAAGPSYLLNLTSAELVGECAGTTPTGLTFTRATAATCTKTDGTVVSLASGQPRVGPRGTLRETAATNLILHNRDLTQTAWIKSNTASTCTASAANGTVLQGVTASGSRNASLYLRRRTGTGTVEVTRDAGTTWVNVTASVGASWTRISANTHSNLAGSVTNPVIGIRLGSSGDAVDIDRAQSETGAVPTSPIDTGGTSATRNLDLFTITKPVGLSETEGCAMVCFEPLWTGNNPYSTSMFLQARVASPIARLLYAVVTSQLAGAHDGTNTITTAAAYAAGVNTCFRTTWSAAGNALTVANLTVPSSSSSAFAGFGAFDATLGLGSTNTGSSGLAARFTAVRLNTTPTGCL
jgi:hypothetical protein